MRFRLVPNETLSAGLRVRQDQRLSVDFDQHRRIDRCGTHQRAGRADRRKDSAVGTGHSFPVRDILYINSCTHHMLECGAGLVKSGFDLLQNVQRLSTGITGMLYRSAGIGSGRAGNPDHIADPHGATIAGQFLPRCSTGNMLTLHAVNRCTFFQLVQPHQIFLPVGTQVQK